MPNFRVPASCFFSTVIAALIAILLLVTTILPAERGIDPTGIGRVLGLTKMGEIKVSLAAEANAKATIAIENAGVMQPVRPVTQTEAPPAVTAKAKGTQQHTMTLVLKPDQGAEIAFHAQGRPRPLRMVERRRAC